MASDLVIGEGVLGRRVEGVHRQLDKVPLEKGVKEIKFTSDEVYSHCPITGQPDFYVVVISLADPVYSIESKSLKLFLQSFESLEDAQFCEKFADTICQEVSETTEAGYTQVTLTQKPRGGISIEATSTRYRMEVQNASEIG